MQSKHLEEQDRCCKHNSMLKQKVVKVVNDEWNERKHTLNMREERQLTCSSVKTSHEV